MKTTKTDALSYVQAWGPDKTAENVAFYMNALQFLAEKHYPALVNAGYNGQAIASMKMAEAEAALVGVQVDIREPRFAACGCPMRERMQNDWVTIHLVGCQKNIGLGKSNITVE